MAKLTFSTTGAWDMADGFGCASLGLAGVCSADEKCVLEYQDELEGIVLTGKYDSILADIQNINANSVFAAIVLFGNIGGENRFLAEFQKKISCPIVGGGAACDGPTGRSGLIPGNGEAAVFLITDDRYEFTTETKCIHSTILEECTLITSDARTILKINGIDASLYLSQWRTKLGLRENDFEHLTLSDCRNINAHLSESGGLIKSGRDVQENMILRYVPHEAVYSAMEAFYNDPNAIVFGCAGLSGLLDKPLATTSLGLFLFGEVCCTDGVSEFGNLMLSKLVVRKKSI